MPHSELRKNLLKDKKRIIIKIGSRILTSSRTGLNLQRIDSIAGEVSTLVNHGYKIVIVSSGAVSAGMKKLGISGRPKTIPQKQAVAAIGQSSLMWAYERSFGKFDKKVAQVLLTYDDLRDRRRFLNARNTLFTLLDYGIIPIINENDTVAVDELKFGDNDNLSSLVTNLVEADLLLILTDTDGFFRVDPKKDRTAKLISLVNEVNDEIEKIASISLTDDGTGGMLTKVQAAKKAAFYGIPTIIANGGVENVITSIINGKDIGTLFLQKETGLKSRKHWIAFTLNTSGALCLDEGAKKAIAQNGKSLLPSGIVRVEGEFEIGDAVSCIDNNHKEFARGLVNYNNRELDLIKGLKTSQIKDKLGYKHSDEVIHRDNLVLI